MIAMILAAGLGTRFKPWTDHHPKALAVINGKSLLQRNVEYLQQFGITEVVVNVHHFADQIEQAVNRANGWGSRITISDERDAVLETGGGLLKAQSLLGKESFVLMNVDILTDLSLDTMIAQHRVSRSLATLAVSSRNTSRYLLFNREMQLCGWRNVQTGEEKLKRNDHALQQFAFSGLHVIDPKIFPLIAEEGKFSIIDVYLRLSPSQEILGFDHSGSRLIDVGKPHSVPLAEEMFR